MFRRYCLSLAVLFMVIGVVSLGNSNSAEKVVTLKLAHDSPPTAAWHVGAVKFAEAVNEKTGGQVKIEIHPAAQLGDQREYFELAQKGIVDIAPQTGGVAGSFIPALNFFNLPFLFNDQNAVKEFYKGPLGRKMLDTTEKYKMKGLSFNTYNFRCPMNSKRPIKTVEDLKGLKMRLMSVPLHIDAYKALGCSVVSIPYSELYMAMKMGAADGFENNYSTISVQKLHETANYYSTLPVFLSASVMLMSLKSWNEKLNASQRQAILDCVADLDNGINNEFDRLEEVHKKVFVQAGVNIYEGPFDLKAFREAVKPVYDKWVPTLPPEAREVVAGLQKQWK